MALLSAVLTAVAAARRVPGRARRPRRHAAGAPFLATSLGHRGRNLGHHGDGRLGRQPQQLLAAVRAPGREHRVEAGHPARGGRQRRPGRGRHGRPIADHRDPAQPVPHLHTAGHHPGRRPGMVTGRAARTPPSPTPPTRWPRPPEPGSLLALLTNGTVKTAAPGYTRWTTLTSQRSLAATPAGRRCGLTDLTAAAFTALGDAAAGRPVQPPRNRRHLRRQERHLAGRRARASRPRWITSTPPCSG